jgi:translocation and assembly module TamB
LSSTCLASSGGGSLCASADWPRRGLDVRGQSLPLSLLVPYLPDREDKRPWLLRGEIALEGHVRPAGNAWQGQFALRSSGGGMKNSERARREVMSYDNLELVATFDPRRINATLATAFNSGGRIDARITTGWDDYAPITGEVSFNTEELVWMELFSPDIVEPKGRLDGRITLAGTRAQPQLGGQARLSQFTTELPSLAIVLEDGNVQLNAQPTAARALSARCDRARARSTSTGRSTGATPRRRCCCRCEGRTYWCPTPATCAPSPAPMCRSAMPPASRCRSPAR